MKIKYTEPKTLIEVEETLLNILKWEDDIHRDDICFTTDSMAIVIEFCRDYKAVYIWIDKAMATTRFSTSNLSPEKIIEGIKLLLDWAGVEYED